ncbi:hypothetical protein ACLOJK_037401, partial [Asimina triloba]
LATGGSGGVVSHVDYDVIKRLLRMEKTLFSVMREDRLFSSSLRVRNDILSPIGRVGRLLIMSRRMLLKGDFACPKREKDDDEALPLVDGGRTILWELRVLFQRGRQPALPACRPALCSNEKKWKKKKSFLSRGARSRPRSSIRTVKTRPQRSIRAVHFPTPDTAGASLTESSLPIPHVRGELQNPNPRNGREEEEDEEESLFS